MCCTLSTQYEQYLGTIFCSSDRPAFDLVRAVLKDRHSNVDVHYITSSSLDQLFIMYCQIDLEKLCKVGFFPPFLASPRLLSSGFSSTRYHYEPWMNPIVIFSS